MMQFFDGFKLITMPVGSGQVRARIGGSGPPLLLLHGNPQTHAMWHAVAPQLARHRTVVCPDLRGYGFSWKPPQSADHAAYAKRAMADELVDLMRGLGHDGFDIVSHDRQGHGAHRLRRRDRAHGRYLAGLDLVPTLVHFERADMAFGLGYYHWFWLAQPHPFPETLISADHEFWFRHHTDREPKDDSFFHPEARADYIAALANPETVRGICEDYRAAASIDLEHDRQSRADGRKIDCPLLVLWGSKGKIEQWYDALAIWRAYANQSVAGHAINSGHYLAEEAPQEVIAAVEQFLDT